MSGQDVSLDWSNYRQIVNSGAVRFLIGRKSRLKGGGIIAGTVSLRDDTAIVLREIALAAMDRLENMAPIEFDPYAHPEVGEEYFVVPQGSEDVDEASPIVESVLTVDSQPDLDANSVSNFDAQFY